MSINKIGIKNFRALNGEYNFEFAPITILTGTNSSGKSSLIKAILLLNNMIRRADIPNSKSSLDTLSDRNKGFLSDENLYKYFSTLYYDDTLNMGNYNYWLNNKQEDDQTISFSFPFYFIQIVEDYTIRFTYAKENAQIPGGELQKIEIFNEVTKKLILFVNGDEFYIDIIEIWNNYIELDKLQVEMQIFCTEIGPIFQDLLTGSSNIIYLDETGEEIAQPWEEYFKEEGESLVLQFLGTIFDENCNSIKGVDYYQPIEFKDFLSRLNEKQIVEFNKIREKVLLQLHHQMDKYRSDICHEEQSDFLYKRYTGFIDLPIFDYDPSKIDDNHLLKPLLIKIEEFRNKSEKINKEKIEYSIEQKVLLRKLQEVEIKALNEAINQEFDVLYKFKSDNSRFSILHRFITNFESALVPKKKFGEDGIISIELKIEPLIRSRLGEEKINDSTFPLDSLIFKDKSKEDTYFNIVNKAFLRNNSINATNLYELDFIPSLRNNTNDRYYTVKEKDNYFSNILGELLQGQDKILNETLEIINNTIKKIGIAESLKFEPSDDGTIINILLNDENNIGTNMADFGNGVNQLIPAITKIANLIINNKRKQIDNERKYTYRFIGEQNDKIIFERYGMKMRSHTIIIEEPESNLHPALQSKLADLFVELSKMGVSFIIETHSEYLIRKLQYLTAKREISPEHTQIYYFYPPNNIPTGKPQVIPININENGYLSNDFGAGFFDEADKIAMSIWSMNQSQSN